VNDQASRLRRLVGSHDAGGRSAATWRRAGVRPVRTPDTPDTDGRLAQAIAITSGKGGVGKSNIAVNLAARLALLEQRVCLLDADLGLANADVLCNLSPRLTLEHVVAGRCRLAEVMLLAPGGFRLIPGACGVTRLADLDGPGRLALLEQLEALDRVADALVIDTAAGLSANVLAFAAAARRVVVVTTPEPTAMTDGYGMIKALACRAPGVHIDLVVNMVTSEAEGRSVFDRMSRVSRTFLGLTLEYAGAVPVDAAVRDAVRHRVPFSLLTPDSPATVAVDRLARRLAGREPAGEPRGGFFSRLAGWLGGGRSENVR